MTNIEKIKLFIANNDPEKVKEYHDRLYENLKELNRKEEKYIFWEFVLIFLYLFTNNITFSNLSLGPVSITDATVIIKILPMTLIYVVYTLHSLTSQKKEAMLVFETILANRYTNLDNKDNSFLTRIYKPYEFLDSIKAIFTDNSSILEALMGLIILLPLIVLGLAPYFICGSMLVDLYKNHMSDGLGKLSFYVTLWIYIIVLFHLINYSTDKESKNPST